MADEPTEQLQAIGYEGYWPGYFDGQEAHVLQAVQSGMTPEKYGRLDPLTPTQLTAVVDGLRDRGLLDAESKLTAPSAARRKTASKH